MKSYGTRWTRNGQYNWTEYEPGEKIEALHFAPPAQTRYIACWYPGKPLLGCCLADGKGFDNVLSQLESLPAEGDFVIFQEPVENGAWWIGKKYERPAGPYSWQQAKEIIEALSNHGLGPA
jgi:hypothetical protein